MRPRLMALVCVVAGCASAAPPAPSAAVVEAKLDVHCFRMLTASGETVLLPDSSDEVEICGRDRERCDNERRIALEVMPRFAAAECLPQPHMACYLNERRIERCFADMPLCQRFAAQVNQPGAESSVLEPCVLK